MRVITLFITLLFSGVLLLCLIFVDIPRIIKSTGYTTGARSISKVGPQTVGVLTTLLVGDRALVKEGDVLGEVTSERFLRGRSLDADQAQITERKLLLNKQELGNIDSAERTTKASLESKITADSIQLNNIQQELLLSRQRQTDLERQLARQKELLAQNFVSTEAVETKHNDLLLQQIGISTLERSQQQLAADVVSLRQELLLNTSRTQTQRILIARALYLQPSFLVLDEATSHLDVFTERQVLQNLKGLGITIVMSAHRPDAIAMADRVYSLQTKMWSVVSNSV